MSTIVLSAPAEARNQPEPAPARHSLPALPYEVTALEPGMDRETMMLHHGKHHMSYVQKLNQALSAFPEIQGRTANWLLLNLHKVPMEIRRAVRHYAGGHVNHSLLWRGMSPAGGAAPRGALAKAITRDFGSFDAFKTRFAQAGDTLLGSGWVWLVGSGTQQSRLDVLCTYGNVNPMSQGHYPILVNDVWEHAYYLKHENRRAAFLENWWPLANWHEADRRYEVCRRTTREDWEAEGRRPPA